MVLFRGSLSHGAFPREMRIRAFCAGEEIRQAIAAREKQILGLTDEIKSLLENKP
jgi:hypothetical protein